MIRSAVAVRCALLVCTLGLPAAAQQQAQGFTNLQLLPEDISRDSLQTVMSAYSSALGVRCSFCHVRTRGKRDFAADDKKAKHIARSMMQLTADINTTLAAHGGDNAPRVVCFTCHRGVTEPHTLQDEVAAKLKTGGIDAARARYDELRQQYYGRAAYDFGENSLIDLAGDLARVGDDYAAIEMLRLNLANHPESVFTLSQLAGALHRIGAAAEARMRLDEALELDPTSRHLQEQLQQLFGPAVDADAGARSGD